MTVRNNNDGLLLGLIVLLSALCLVVAFVGYHAGFEDGKDHACSTGKVYSVDSLDVVIASRSLKIAMLPTTSANSRRYLIDHVQALLDDVGQTGPLQVECR